MSKRLVLYALVARQPSTVLAEHSADSASGNFSSVTSQLLEKLPEEDTMLFYAHDSYYFHVLTEDQFAYLCVAEQKVGKIAPMKFLKDLKNAFREQFGDRANTARAMAYDADFKPVMRRLMSQATSSYGDEKIVAVRSELDQAKQIMEKNIDKAIDRGEKLSILVDKSENVKSRAVTFQHKTKELKNQFWCERCRSVCLLLLLLLVIV